MTLSNINYHQGNVIPDVLPKFTKSKPKTLLEERIETIGQRKPICECEPLSISYSEPIGSVPSNDPPIRWQKVRGKWLWVCTICELERIKGYDRINQLDIEREQRLRQRELEELRQRELEELTEEVWKRTEVFGYSNCIDRFSQLPNVKNIELCGSSGLVFEYWN